MASMGGVMNTFSTQTSMAAPINCDRTAGQHREAGRLYCIRAKEPTRSASGVEGSSCKSTPHPAYGSELSTGGGRLVRAWSAMEAARHPFPVSSTAPHYRRIKSESQEYFETCSWPI